MKRHAQFACFLVVTAILCALGLNAQQSSGSIRGTVKDSQGAVVVGVKVVLTDVAQGDARESTTNQDGVFFFNPLKPSVYKTDGGSGRF